MVRALSLWFSFCFKQMYRGNLHGTVGAPFPTVYAEDIAISVGNDALVVPRPGDGRPMVAPTFVCARSWQR